MGKNVRSPSVKFMGIVAKEIIDMKIDSKDNFDALNKRFYRIMRRYGIKYGTKSKGGAGTVISNSEWVMCRTLFFSRINSFMSLEELFDSEVPKDLFRY